MAAVPCTLLFRAEQYAQLESQEAALQALDDGWYALEENLALVIQQQMDARTFA